MKKRLLHTFQPLASKIPLEWLVKITGQRLFSPFYHSVENGKPLKHIKHLYTLRTINEFEKDLDFLLKYYQPIGLEDLVAQIKSGQPFQENKFFLSFDDGLREVYDCIAPLLLKKGIPATIFLNAAFVNNKDLFYRYKVSLLIEHLLNKEILTGAKHEIQKILGVENLQEGLLQVDFKNRKMLDDVAEILEIDFHDFLKMESPYLTTVQINELIKNGFTFGSHSVDHPKYNDLNLSEQLIQTSKSQEYVDKEFKQAIKAFAFPFTDFGVSDSFFKTVYKEKIVDITFGTAGLKNDSVPFNVQRFPVEELPFQMYELVASEYIYYAGKALFGKNKINRK